jgi:hypothetical protein
LAEAVPACCPGRRAFSRRRAGLTNLHFPTHPFLQLMQTGFRVTEDDDNAARRVAATYLLIAVVRVGGTGNATWVTSELGLTPFVVGRLVLQRECDEYSFRERNSPCQRNWF